MKARRSAAGLLLPVLLLALSQTGCTAIFPSMSQAGEDQLDVPVLGTCTVEVRAEGNAARSEEMPVTEGLHMQDVAEACGAARRFRQMEGYVIRKGENDRSFQMKGVWDCGSRRFAVHTDYAIQPGDRVVFIEDASTLVDGVLSSLLGPFGSR